MPQVAIRLDATRSVHGRIRTEQNRGACFGIIRQQ